MNFSAAPATLSAEHLTQALGGKAVLHGLNVTAHPAQITAVIGPNGAGKSTLLQLLAGLSEPVGGQVRLGDVPLLQLSRRERASRLAFLAQSEPLPAELRVQEAVTLGLGAGHWLGGLLSLGSLSAIEVQRVSLAMQRAGISELAHRRIAELSGGEVQRTTLARALVSTPEFLLLDEPTNHLDIGYAVNFMRQLRQLAASGVGVVAALHDLNLAAWADQLWLLQGGQLVAAGPPQAVLTAPHLRQVYGLEADILHHAGRVVVAWG